MGIEKPFLVVKRILLTQAIVVVFVPAVAFCLYGWLEARSALFGGIIGFLPNALFAYIVARSQGKAAPSIVRAFYVGESTKLIFTALLFVAVFQIPDIFFVPLFIGFTAVIAVYWFALLWRVS